MNGVYGWCFLEFVCLPFVRDIYIFPQNVYLRFNRTRSRGDEKCRLVYSRQIRIEGALRVFVRSGWELVGGLLSVRDLLCVGVGYEHRMIYRDECTNTLNYQENSKRMLKCVCVCVGYVSCG